MPAAACITGIGYMNRDFELGDLVKFKKGSSAFRELEGTDSLVVVTRLLPASNKFFYGRVCSTWEEHLWSYDQFSLLSRSGSEKNF